MLNSFFNQRIILEALLAAKDFSKIPSSFISVKQNSWWASWVSLVVQKHPASAGDSGDAGVIPESERPPGGGHGSPLQHPCWESPWTEEPGGLQPRGSQSRTRLRGLTRMHRPRDCHFSIVFLLILIFACPGSAVVHLQGSLLRQQAVLGLRHLGSVVVACGLRCPSAGGVLVLSPRIEPHDPGTARQSLNHRTARGVL